MIPLRSYVQKVVVEMLYSFISMTVSGEYAPWKMKEVVFQLAGGSTAPRPYQIVAAVSPEFVGVMHMYIHKLGRAIFPSGVFALRQSISYLVGAVTGLVKALCVATCPMRRLHCYGIIYTV